MISRGDGEDKKSGTPEAPASILLWCMVQMRRTALSQQCNGKPGKREMQLIFPTGCIWPMLAV